MNVRVLVSPMYPELVKMKKLDKINIQYLEGYVRSLTLHQLRTPASTTNSGEFMHFSFSLNSGI